MEPYLTLYSIYQAVKDTKHPSSYICSPSDIILRHPLPWENIIEHLKQLEQEGMAKFHQYNQGFAFSITDDGINRIMKNNSYDLQNNHS
jgi:hypothetical protein